MCVFFFFFKQKTAYEMRISDWSSDVCSSDLERSAVDDQPCRNIKDPVGFDQPVLRQCAPARNKIDDPGREAQRGGKFHRAVELDAFGLDSPAFEMAADRRSTRLNTSH